MISGLGQTIVWCRRSSPAASFSSSSSFSSSNPAERSDGVAEYWSAALVRAARALLGSRRRDMYTPFSALPLVAGAFLFAGGKLFELAG